MPIWQGVALGGLFHPHFNALQPFPLPFMCPVIFITCHGAYTDSARAVRIHYFVSSLQRANICFSYQLNSE